MLLPEWDFTGNGRKMKYGKHSMFLVPVCDTQILLGAVSAHQEQSQNIFHTPARMSVGFFLSILTAISSRNELLQTFGNELLQTFGNEVLQTFNKRKMLSSNSRYCTLQESPAWHSRNPGFMDFCSCQFEARLKSGFTGPSFPGSCKNLQWSKRAEFQSRVLLWFFHWRSRL